MTVLSLLITILYVVLPGLGSLPFRGFPLTLLEVVGLVALLTAYVWSRPATSSARTSWTPIVVLSVASALKLALAFAWFPAGWLTRYYANDSFAPAIERSTDFPPFSLKRFRDEATRIDPALDFRDTSFPVHFFNEYRFDHGERREYTDAFSVEWRGRFEAFDQLELTLILEARGAAELLIDERREMAVDSPVADGRNRADVVIPPGEHIFSVRYRKPANTEGFLRLSRFDAGMTRVLSDPVIRPFRTLGWRNVVKGLLPAAGWMTHGAALIALASWLGPMLWQRARDVASTSGRAPLEGFAPIVMPVLMAVFATQGTIQAWPLVDRVWTLAAGSDGFRFESRAREILTKGWLMTPSFDDPGYGYFVALAHRVAGESLAGVILVNFILLGLASGVVYRLAAILVGPRTAMLAAAWLLALQQLDFVRSSTVGLFSENLFFVTTAVTVFGLTRHLQSGRTGDLVLAAAAGGLSSLTQLSFVLFLPLAAALIAVAGWRRALPARAIQLVALFVALWLLTMAPDAIRHYQMWGERVLAAWGHKAPGQLFAHAWTTLAASLGMRQWTVGSLDFHPELSITAVFYLLSVAFVPRARTLDALPVHAFVVAHVAAQMLSTPATDGYRTMLPVFVFMPVFCAALLLRVLPPTIAQKRDR